MKIKILYAPTIYPDRFFLSLPPLGIATIKAYLNSNNIHCDIDDLQTKIVVHNEKSEDKVNLAVFEDEKNIEVYINDDFKEPNPLIERNLSKMLSLINHADYDVIGFSVMTNFQYNISICLAHYFKKHFNKMIIFGGEYTKFYKTFLEKNKNIDFVLGNNVQKLIKIMGGKILDSKDTLYYMPNFDGLPLEEYKKKLGFLVLHYERFKGCLYKCKFCVTNQKIIFKDMDLIIKELELLKLKYNTPYFSFLDNGTNIIKGYAEKFSKKVIEKKLGLKWCSYIIPKDTSVELLDLLKKSGCFYLRYGMESGSERILKNMGKTHTIESSQKMIKNAKKSGIYNHMLFILDYIDETDDDFFDTMEFLEYNSDYINSIQIKKFSLFKNSHVYNNLKKYNIKLIKTDSKIPTTFLLYKRPDEYMSFSKKRREIEKLCKRNHIDIFNISKSDELFKKAFECS